MPNDPALARRNLLKGAAVGGAAALTTPAAAQPAPVGPPAAAATATPAPGYMFLKPEEVAFVEAMVDTMIPEDELTPKGTEMGPATFIDRALADGWGKGDRLYLQGPWKQGTPNQGYQLSLTPAALWRAGIEATNAHCVKTHNQPFDQHSETQRNQVLTDLDAGRITFADGLPARDFWSMAYGNVMEGMFADPIYGGNRDKAGWRLVGFPGVIQNNRNNVVTWRNRKYEVEPVSISDMS